MFSVKKTLNEKLILSTCLYCWILPAVCDNHFGLGPYQQITYRGGTIIRDHLVRSHYVPPPSPGTWLNRKTVGCFHCSGCIAWTHITPGKPLVSKNTSKTFLIKDLISCRCTGVIYLATCLCGLEDIGKTSCEFHCWVGDHLRNICLKHKKKLFHAICGVITPMTHWINVSWALTWSLYQFDEVIWINQFCSGRPNGYSI